MGIIWPVAETGRVNIIVSIITTQNLKKQSSSWSVQLNLQTLHCHWSPFLEFFFIIHHPPSFLGVKTPFQHARTKHKSWFFLEVPTLSISGQATSRYGANVLQQMFCDRKLWKKKPTGFSQKPLKNSCLWWRNLRVKPSHPWWCHGLAFTQRETFGWASKTCIFVGWLPVEFPPWIPAETCTPPPSYLVLKGDASKGLIAIPTLFLEGNRAYQLRIDHHMVGTGAAILLSPFLWVPLLKKRCNGSPHWIQSKKSFQFQSKNDGLFRNLLGLHLFCWFLFPIGGCRW